MSRLARVAAAALPLLLAATLSGQARADPRDEPSQRVTTSGTTAQSPAPERPVLATVPPAKYGGLSVQINKLQRTSDGAVLLVWTITNESNEDGFHTGTAFNDWDLFEGTGLGGVRLLDKAGDVRYHPMRRATHECVCTVVGVLDAGTILDKGESTTMYDMYKVEPDVSRVTVEVPGFVATRVPIS